MKRFALILVAALAAAGAWAQIGPQSGGSATPTGTAGGDLSGTYPNPTVAKVNGVSVPQGVGGYTDPINMSISATAGSNILTIALKGQNGSDPSASNPVYIPFRSTTLTTSAPVWATATAALSIATPASGATLGSASSNVPFRFWIVAVYDGNTLDLGLINCSTTSSTASQIYTLNEGVLQTTTILNGSSTSAGVIYTGTARTSFAVRILGYLDYSAGLTTAGTYASGPTTVQLAGPSVKKPGDVVQRILATTASNTTVTAATTLTTTNVTVNITPSTTVNLIRVMTSGTLTVVGTATADITTTAQLYRGTTAIGKLVTGGNVGGAATAWTSNAPISIETIDGPASISAQTYAVKIQNSGTTASTSGAYPGTGGTIVVEEIQG